MKLLRCSTYFRRTAVVWLWLVVLSQLAAAQIWIASTGSVDESSISTYSFVGQLAFVRSTVDKGTVTLRYNVLPAGDLLKPLVPCCEAWGLRVRFLDNGSAAQVLVKLKQYDVTTGQVKTLLTFDSNQYPPQSGFQESSPLTFCCFFNFSFAQFEAPPGCCAYYVEAELVRGAPGGTPGLGSIRIVRLEAP